MANDTETGPMRILIVCTGNICRSPLAQQLLQARLLEAGLTATVISAGTHALIGRGMTPEAADLSRQFGSHTTAHAAQQLSEALIASVDLVLTATREHRREVVSMLPKATRYTFTLNQFARLVTAETEPGIDGATAALRAQPKSGSFADVVAAIAANRGLLPPPSPATLDDIEDPYRQSAAVYDRVGALVNASVITVASALGAVLR